MDYKTFRVTIKSPSSILITKPQGIPLADDDPPKVPMDPLRKRTIDILGRYLAKDKVESREELVVLGSHLFNGLFDEKASRVFKEELEKWKKKGFGLRLILEFRETARELAELPWEYVYFPDGLHEQGKGFFIAADPESHLILARHVPQLPVSEDLEATPRPLRILIVVSQPEEFPPGEEPLGEVVATTVITEITKLADDSDGAIETDVLRQPSKRSLTEKIKKFEPHVVHFLCHGKYVPNSGGSLAFVQESDGKTLAWVSDDKLPECFVPAPRLIFLHACEGAHSDSYEAFRGVALQLVYSRIPAVVAMQYQVKNKVANAFALTFYKSLGEGKPIDEAVQDGRLELLMYLEDESFSSQAFGSPVVFLQSADGIIMVPEADEKGQSEQADTGAGPSSFKCTSCAVSWISSPGFCSTCGHEYILCPADCGQLTERNKPYCRSCQSRVLVESAAAPGEAPDRRAEAAATFHEALAPAGAAAELSRRAPQPPEREPIPTPDQLRKSSDGA